MRLFSSVIVVSNFLVLLSVHLPLRHSLVKLAANVGSIPYTKVENQLLKGDSGKYPKLNDFVSNVQNIYQKFNGDVAVASNSIPNYSNIFTDPYDKKITFSGSSETDLETLVVTTNSDHGFITGDASSTNLVSLLTFKSLLTGLRLSTKLRVSLRMLIVMSIISRESIQLVLNLQGLESDIFSNKFVSLVGEVTDNEFIYFDFFNKKLCTSRYCKRSTDT